MKIEARFRALDASEPLREHVLRPVHFQAGARMSDDAEALASELVKLEQASKRAPARGPPATASLFIVNPFGAVESLARWFSTHPSTEERVRRLRAMAARVHAARSPPQGRTNFVPGG